MSESAPTGAGPRPVEPSPVDRIAEAVQACPAVADLHGGAFGTIATYLPGRQITGVRVTGGSDPAIVGLIEVHVAGRYPHPVGEISAQVRTAVRSVVPGSQVAVCVEDYC